MLYKCEGCAYCYEDIDNEPHCIKGHICDWNGCEEYEPLFDESEVKNNAKTN